MTTIAYKDGVIAYDSRCTQGMTIVDDECDKHREENGIHYFFCGSVCDQQILIDCHQGAQNVQIPKGCNSSAMIYDGESIYTSGFDKDSGFHCSLERMGNVIAMGSGADHALTAMDMGADAEAAVKMAIKRDAGSGGTIRTFKLK